MPRIASLGVMNAVNFGMASSTQKTIIESFYFVFSGLIYAYKVNSDVGFTAGSSGTDTFRSSSTNFTAGYDSCIACSEDNTTVAVGTSTSACAINAFPFSKTTGFGTRYANPASVVQNVWAAKFTKTKSHIVLAGRSGSYYYLMAYAWSNGFGTQTYSQSNLNGQFQDFGKQSLSVNKNNNAIITTHQNSPYIYACAWNNGFGTKFADLSPLITDAICTEFSADGSAVFVGGYTSPYINAYAWSTSGFGTKFSNPSTPTNNANGIQLIRPLPDNTGVALLGRSYGAITEVYNWSSSGFGTQKIADYISSGGTNSLDIDPSSTILVSSVGSTTQVKNIKTLTPLYNTPSPVANNGSLITTFTN